MSLSNSAKRRIRESVLQVNNTSHLKAVLRRVDNHYNTLRIKIKYAKAQYTKYNNKKKKTGKLPPTSTLIKALADVDNELAIASIHLFQDTNKNIEYLPPYKQPLLKSLRSLYILVSAYITYLLDTNTTWPRSTHVEIEQIIKHGTVVMNYIQEYETKIQYVDQPTRRVWWFW